MKPPVNEASTSGIDHIGLAVADLAATTTFFVDALGWVVIGERPSYPARFVSDGSVKVTLWRVANPGAAIAFDRKNNVGLHHLALRVESLETLERLHGRLKCFPGVVIEFSPERMGMGSAIHMMISEPSGNRIEFAHRPDTD